MSKRLDRKPAQRFTKGEAVLMSRRLNDSELNTERRWWFNYQRVDGGWFEIIVTDETGEEIARW